MSEPQDVAEGLDEEMTGTDPVTSDELGGLDMPGELPFAVDEDLVSEPIVDSFASRDDRTMPEADLVPHELLDSGSELFGGDQPEDLIADEVHLVADDTAMTAEESALHLEPESDTDTSTD